MDRLIVKGDKISEYVYIMKNYINDFIDIVMYLDSEKNKLLWESDNYDIMMEKYDNMIKENLAYADRMMKLMHYLDNTLDRYDETVHIIKNDYQKIDDDDLEEVMK